LEVVDSLPNTSPIEVKKLRKAMDNLAQVLGECSVSLLISQLKKNHGLDLDPNSQESIELNKFRYLLRQELGDGANFLFRILKSEMDNLLE
jgi:hypothetical protein